MTWREFVVRTMGSDQQQEAATKAGVKPSTVSRWLSTGRPGEAGNVAAFARGYGIPVIEAFVEAGFLSAKEAKVRPAARPDLSQLTNDELLELVRARMSEEVVGNAEHPAPNTLRAVASGDTGDAAEARQASDLARDARAEQEAAMQEMNHSED